MARKEEMFNNQEFIGLNNRLWRSSIQGHFYPLEAPGQPDQKMRCQLRQLLVSRLETVTDLGESRKQLLQPGIPPKLQDIAISISHCRTFAGFIFELSPHTSLGLDVEQKSRITHKAVEYIAGQKELSRAPSPAFLWGAKEAAFKAIHSPEQKTPLSHIRIDNWCLLPQNDRAYSFSFSFQNFEGTGHTGEREGLIFAVTRAIVSRGSFEA